MSGGISLYGDAEQSPLQHGVSAEVIHRTPAHHPLVHMVCWDEEDPCKVEVSGRVTVAGDPEAPVRVNMAHVFENDHRQTHHVEPVDHTLHVDSRLSDPIHHALQLRTPIELRFCNPWHIASDYRVEVRWGERSLMSIRLTGATVARPQPCDGEIPCAPVVSRPIPYS